MQSKFLAKISGDYFTDIPQLQNMIASINRNALVDSGMMCGGGNIVRGTTAKMDIGRNYIDTAGRFSTMINATYLSGIYNNLHIPHRIVTPHQDDIVRLNDGYKHFYKHEYRYQRDIMHTSQSQASSAENQTEALIFAGGLGCGYISTDFALVIRALEYGLTPVKITKVGGIFDKDPKIYQDAKISSKIQYKDAMATSALDTCAAAVAMENDVDIYVMDLDNYVNMINGHVALQYTLITS